MAMKKHKCFVMLEKELLISGNYRRLLPSAKVIYTYAKLEAGRQIRPNGTTTTIYSAEFVFPYKLIHKYTNLSTPAISTALKELRGGGFIQRTVAGGLRGAGGVPNKYRLSLKWQESSPIIKQKRTIRAKKKACLNNPYHNQLSSAPNATGISI
ncbi:MAG: hypothetical protein WC081_05655 [Candidatus Ratteibacteria bacterium]|jgi:hypothetical protein